MWSCVILLQSPAHVNGDIEVTPEHVGKWQSHEMEGAWAPESLRTDQKHWFFTEV